MHRNADPYKIRLVGPPEHPRFVIRDARRLVDTFWTGRGWSRRLRDARLFADPDDVATVVERMSRRYLRRHEPKRLYLLTVMVRVHADESVSRRDLENYLKDALSVGVDYEQYGHGPTEGSLVEVVVPAISLEEGR